MPLLEVIQTRLVSASIRLDEGTAAQVDQYAAFIHATADDVVDKALNYVFAKDRDFQEFLKSPQAAQVAATLRIRKVAATDAAESPMRKVVTVQKSTGERANYDPRRLTGVSVYREVAHDFSAGDRIQFTAPDKAPGVANRGLAVLESVGPDGQIIARLDNNRRIEFNASEHRHFDHGYALTSHSSQRLTAERVLVNADTGVHRDNASLSSQGRRKYRHP
jgi:ATP-dependent exoDNAse (exonuclease V) alpha subunit